MKTHWTLLCEILESFNICQFSRRSDVHNFSELWGILVVIDWCNVSISAQLPLKGTPAFKYLHFQVFQSDYKLFYLTIFSSLSHSVILYFVPSIYPSTTVRACSHLWKKCPLCCHHFVKWRWKCQVSCLRTLRTMNKSRWCNSSVCFIHKEKELPPTVQKFVKSLWCLICDVQSWNCSLQVLFSPGIVFFVWCKCLSSVVALFCCILFVCIHHHFHCLFLYLALNRTTTACPLTSPQVITFYFYVFWYAAVIFKSDVNFCHSTIGGIHLIRKTPKVLSNSQPDQPSDSR